MKHLLPELRNDECKPCDTPKDESGFGALATERGCLPLKALDVQARLDGLIARVMLTQTFVNVHAEALEATYIFPLPDRAAVTHFRLEVAGRIVEGELKERDAARQEYERAIRTGHRAAIAEEERPGVFTMRVGNLPPGEEATVRVTLTGPLPYHDGEATFRFPLVVAPRYIPGTPLPGDSVGDGVSADTDAVPDASRISPPVLLPGFPNPVRLRLSVEVPLASLQPNDFRSTLHTVLESDENDTKLFQLQTGERLDRDFILRFRIGRDRVVASLALQPDCDGAEGTFLLTLIPPRAEKKQGKGRDVVFVLDRSGSMSGWKMVAARRALARMVDTLGEDDRFTLYAFDDRIETPPEFHHYRLQSATDRLRFHAVEFLAKIDARNGTEMAEPLNLAVDELSLDKAAQRERILVLVTDGQVGNEDQILKHLGQRLKEIRVFTLGIDQAVNAGFLRRLADIGGGQSEFVESEDRLDEAMDSIHRHLGAPVLTGLRLEPAGLKFLPDSVTPSRLPDLFADTPLFLSGRYRGDAGGAIALQGRDAAGQMWSAEMRAHRVDNPALTTVWARGRLREMEDRYIIGAGDRTALEREIVTTSLRFGVLCRFTAFVAVDRSEVVNPGGIVHGMVQPVEQPAGWETMQPCAASLSGPSNLRLRGITRAVPQRQVYRKAKSEVDAQPPSPLCPKLSNTDFDASEDAYSTRDLSGAAGPNVIERFLSLFFGRKERKKGQRATIDRTPYLQQAHDVIQSLQGSQKADVSDRLTVLRSLAPKVEELFRVLVAAGDRDSSVKALGESLLRLHALLAETQPAETNILNVWTDIENCLQRWLTLSETPPREGFWK